MIRRRDLLIGGATLGSAGAAFALTPRRRLVLAQGVALEKMVPKTLPGWSAANTEGLVVPKDEDDLASKLYTQIVQRVYQQDGGDGYVMLLIAYGDTQNDLLQLHRPEVCYAAFGFTISDQSRWAIPIAPGTTLPCRRLTATAPERVEYITYWTRIGEELPTDGGEQRWAKLRTQFAGVVPDGALVRISSGGMAAKDAFTLNDDFARQLIRTMRPNALPALVGSQRAAALARPNTAT